MDLAGRERVFTGECASIRYTAWYDRDMKSRSPVCEFERCGQSLRASARSVARFCSTRCRVAAHRARRAVPAELRSRNRWVRRSADKMPLTAAGRAASSTDRRTWCSYSAARASKAGIGLGFVLDGDGIVCLDFDHCIDERGRIAAWAQQVLDRLPATYVEVSPSGTGLHVFGYGQVDKGRRIRRGDLSVEVYGRGRYIAVTGQRLSDAPARLADISEVIASLT